MAFRHGRYAEITVEANDLSDYCDSAELTLNADTAETTTFGDDWKSFIGGLRGGSLTLSGNYDPTASTGPAAVLETQLGKDDTTIELYPGGNTSGQRKHAFEAIVTSYSESSAVGDKVTFSAQLTVNGAVTTTTVGA